MKDDLIYVRHILDAIEKIERYLNGASYESFLDNEMMIDAIVRELEIVGEAAGNLSEEFQKKYPELPFDEMIGMRNRLIHEYFGVDTDIVWKTCVNDLKELKKLIKKVVM